MTTKTYSKKSTENPLNCMFHCLEVQENRNFIGLMAEFLNVMMKNLCNSKFFYLINPSLLFDSQN